MKVGDNEAILCGRAHRTGKTKSQKRKKNLTKTENNQLLGCSSWSFRNELKCNNTCGGGDGFTVADVGEQDEEDGDHGHNNHRVSLRTGGALSIEVCRASRSMDDWMIPKENTATYFRDWG